MNEENKKNVIPQNGLETHNFFIKIVRVFSVPIMNYIPEYVLKTMMRSSSKDASEVVAKGGTTHALEAMYTRYHRGLFERGLLQGVADLFWHHIVSQPKAIRNRLKIVSKIIEDQINATQDKSSYSILSIAGGSARSIIQAAVNVRRSEKNINVEVITIDKDSLALEKGKSISKEVGFSDNFKWIHGSASDIDVLTGSTRFDLVEIVGLLDYFNDERVLKLLAKSHAVLNENGKLVIANVIPNREKRFIHKTGWPMMYYRRQGELATLAEQAGFIVDKDIVEPLRVHNVVLAHKK